MRRVAIRGLLGRKLRDDTDGDRDRPRRRDGERHVRPHRHDREGVRLDLLELVRADGRGRHRQEARRVVAERQGAGLAGRAREGAGAAGGRRRRRDDPRPLRRHEPGEDPRQGRQGDPGEQPDLRPRHRPRGRAVQPLQARRRRLGGRPAPGRRRRSTPPTNRASRSATPSGSPATGRSAPSRSPASPASATSAALGGATIASSTSRPLSSVLRKSRLRRDRPWPRSEGVGQEKLIDSIATVAARDRRGAHRRRAGGRGRQGRRRVRHVHPLLPARLRRHRALRRRVRDLQHALDHGRPADARARDAANARRLAAPGAPLGGARGVS